MSDNEFFASNLAFQLVKLGAWANAAYAARLSEIGLRPRHVGLLELLAEEPLGQLEIARRLGVTPSVVVDMLDELEALGAVRRRRDQRDRRRQTVERTPRGSELSAHAQRLAGDLDDTLLAPLPARDRTAARRATLRLAAAHGLAGRRPTTAHHLDRDPDTAASDQAR